MSSGLESCGLLHPSAVSGDGRGGSPICLLLLMLLALLFGCCVPGSGMSWREDPRSVSLWLAPGGAIKSPSTLDPFWRVACVFQLLLVGTKPCCCVMFNLARSASSRKYCYFLVISAAVAPSVLSWGLVGSCLLAPSITYTQGTSRGTNCITTKNLSFNSSTNSRLPNHFSAESATEVTRQTLLLQRRLAIIDAATSNLSPACRHPWRRYKAHTHSIASCITLTHIHGAHILHDTRFCAGSKRSGITYDVRGPANPATDCTLSYGDRLICL
ncbi:hypothetical protein J3F83DRAFT_475458 [Trichoderma novae-zelandiae]